MKKFVVRFLSLVMAALMVLGCAAFAEEDYSGKVTISLYRQGRRRGVARGGRCLHCQAPRR